MSASSVRIPGTGGRFRAVKLACIPVDPPIDMEIGLLWRKGTYLRSGASQFMDFMVRQGGARR